MNPSRMSIIAAATLLSGAAFAQTPAPAPSTAPPAGSAATTDPACAAAWQKAAPKAGMLDETQAKSVVRDFKQVDLNGDRKVDANEWKSGCAKGLIVTADASDKSGGSTPNPKEHAPTNRMNEAVPDMKAK